MIKSILRILGLIIGALLSVFGLMLLIAGASMIFDGDPDGPLGLAIAVVFLIAGISLMLVLIRRSFAQSPQLTAEPVLTNTPVQASSTNQPSVSPSTHEAFEKLLTRSDNILATLKDLISHGQSSSSALLNTCLSRSGLLEWSPAFPLNAIKLSRSGRWWISSSTDELTEDDFDKIEALEAILNVNQDSTSTSQDVASSIQRVLSHVSELGAITNPRSSSLLVGKDTGEWAFRLRFSDLAENAQVPLRLSFSTVSNTEQGIADIFVEVPRPSAFVGFANDKSTQTNQARAYALRIALCCARFAFEAGPSLQNVQVRAHVHNSSETLLCLKVGKQELKALTKVAKNPAVDAGSFPKAPYISAEFDENGWFKELDLDSLDLYPINVINPELRRTPPELIDDVCSDEIKNVTGATHIYELGINENAGRLSEWDKFAKSLDENTTTSDAVSKLVALRDSTKDLSIAEACERTSKALVDGKVDIGDKGTLAQLFAYGSSLDTCVNRAQAAVDNPEENNPEAALAALQETLAPLMQTGMYMDDSETIYRYFNSVSDRIFFNLDIDDHTRKVRLVPDAYYRAHSLCARLLSLLGREEEASPHVEEIMRVAPATVDAMLLKVRHLENKSQIFEAADLLKKAIVASPTARDMAICHYRLAYMEWKLGRSDLSVACYQRAINLRQQVSDQAEEELKDLLEGDSSLKMFESDDEIARVLEEAGIPYGPIGALRDRTVHAAQAAADAGLFTTARALTGALIDLGRDDALIDTYQSFSVSL